MTLTIGALSLNDQPLSQPYMAHFDAAGGTIGRGEHNTLMLPDPQRHISRQHARISAHGTAYRLTNLSSANTVTVAGRSLSAGDSAPIHHGDQLRIGGFLLEVIENTHARAGAAPAAEARTITAGRAALCASMAMQAGAGAARADAWAPGTGTGIGNASFTTAAAPGPEPASARELWQAFREAAGIDVELPQGPGPAEMRVLGQLLRAAVDGTMRLLSSRAPQRHGLSADTTPTLPPDNNPLDIAANGKDALELLLQPPVRGFVPAAAAMADAMHELLGHQAGQRAAWCAALDAAFEPFAPPALEARYRPDLPAHSLLHMSRRSRLWSRYVDDFSTLSLQARDRLQARSDQAYVEACDHALEHRPGAALHEGLRGLPELPELPASAAARPPSARVTRPD